MVMAGKRQNSARYDVINYLGLVAILVLLNYVLSFFFGRFDFTEDKRHSLSPNTIAMLEDEERFRGEPVKSVLGILPDEQAEVDAVFFKIYLEGDLPADMMRIRNAIQEKL